MLKQYFSNQTKNFQKVTAVLFILIVAGIGTYLIIFSRAATPYASITADQGTLANGATKQTCSGASGGSCVQFGSTSSGSGSVTWYGTFAGGSIDPALYPYSNFVSGHVQVVADPLGSGQKVLQFAINDSDRPYSGATNPRGDVESPHMFHPGNDVFVSIPVLVPTAVPSASAGWFQVAEVYGQPYGGSPTMGIDLSADSSGLNHIVLARDVTHNDQPWVGPALDGKWHTVILHVHFATDNTGFVQIWYDGTQQKFTDGTTQLNYITLQSGINWDGTDGNFLNINEYRQAGAFPGTVTIYHGAPAVGTTLSAVESEPVP
jgi:hypothetical protein